MTAVLVDAAWPSWLGLEAWLLPWVVPYYLEHAARVAAALPDARLVAFADPRGVVERGFVEGTAPPWRRGARQDAARAHDQVARLTALLAGDPVGSARGWSLASSASTRGRPSRPAAPTRSTSAPSCAARARPRRAPACSSGARAAGSSPTGRGYSAWSPEARRRRRWRTKKTAQIESTTTSRPMLTPVATCSTRVSAPPAK